jgi:hypothetical protein
VSRGGKEGNNAFCGDEQLGHSTCGLFEESVLYLLRHGNRADLLDTFAQSVDPARTTQEAADARKHDQMHTCENRVQYILQSSDGVWEAVRMGNLVMAKAAFDFMQKHGGTGVSHNISDDEDDENSGNGGGGGGGGAFGVSIARNTSSIGGNLIGGFNLLHAEILRSAPLVADRQVRANSATKKTGGNYSLTPVHLAAIHPDTRYLQALWDILGVDLLQQVDERGKG